MALQEVQGCPEPLEKIFQKVEEESARRAQEEQERAAIEAAASSSVDPSLMNVTGEDDEPTALTGGLTRPKSQRRRGSVSISRIGIIPGEDITSSNPHLPPSSPSHLSMAARSPFYQAQLLNSSTTSIASGASAHSQADAHAEDDTHVTQMHHIIPKPSISSKLITMPRRLSRSHSATVIPTTNLGLGVGGEQQGLVIGVSVQKDTVESEMEEGEEGGRVSVSRRASVTATGVGVRRGRGGSVSAGAGAGTGVLGNGIANGNGGGGLDASVVRKQASRSTLSGRGTPGLKSLGEERVVGDSDEDEDDDDDGVASGSGGSATRATSGSRNGISRNVNGAGSGGMAWWRKAKELTTKLKRKTLIMGSSSSSSSSPARVVRRDE